MKQILIYSGVAAAALISVGVGAWLGLKYQKISYKRLPGLYRCEEFGFPLAHQNEVEISPEFKVSTGESTGPKFPLGVLHNFDGYRGRLELNTDVVHTTGLTLDPLAKNFIEGTTLGLQLVSSRDGREKVLAVCRKFF